MEVLTLFGDASPELIAARALQQRIDRKYLLSQRLLEPVLAGLVADYRVARAGDVLAAHYETVYFDTSDRRLFDDHRRGRFPRYKVRLRHHCDRRLTFLEVKRRGGCTSKARLELPFSGGAANMRAAATELSDSARGFIDYHCPIGADRLVPRVWVTFTRLTLVGGAFNERVTFDWNIEFGDEYRSERFPGLVVGEVKQARFAHAGPVVHVLRRLRISEETLSKYCLATVRLAPVRGNTFKPALRAVERVIA
jgi:VTC domain-containing protein